MGSWLGKFVRTLSLLALLASASACRKEEDPPTQLVFLQVGQGDCTIFLHQGHTVMIDAGPRTDRVDSGERIIVPALHKLGVRAIDLLILTHPDIDHIGGMKSILRRYSVGKVFAPKSFDTNQDLLRELDASRISPDEVLWTQQAVAKVGDYKIEIAAPQHFLGQSDNDGSMFTRISGENCSAILTGDASSDVESKMIRALQWKCDVLKGGHHGSKNSTGLRILHDAAPKFVVFSCGRNNVYGHPAPEALDRAARIGAKIFRTDQDGTITFVPGMNGFVVRK